MNNIQVPQLERKPQTLMQTLAQKLNTLSLATLCTLGSINNVLAEEPNNTTNKPTSTTQLKKTATAKDEDTSPKTNAFILGKSATGNITPFGLNIPTFNGFLGSSTTSFKNGITITGGFFRATELDLSTLNDGFFTSVSYGDTTVTYDDFWKMLSLSQTLTEGPVNIKVTLNQGLGQPGFANGYTNITVGGQAPIGPFNMFTDATGLKVQDQYTINGKAGVTYNSDNLKILNVGFEAAILVNGTDAQTGNKTTIQPIIGCNLNKQL